MRIGLLLLAVCFIVVGFFQLVKYVPSVKEALILATTVKPETFTELYFEDHLSLPNKVTLFKENNFAPQAESAHRLSFVISSRFGK